jgi:hypothetical protein
LVRVHASRSQCENKKRVWIIQPLLFHSKTRTKNNTEISLTRGTIRAHQDTQEHLHYGVAGQFVQASRGLTRWGGGDDSGGPSDRTGSLLGYPLGVGCRFRWSRLGHSSGRLCLGATGRSWSDRQKGGNRNKRRPGLLLRQEPLFVKIAQVKQGLARSVPFVSTTRRVGRQILIGNRRGGDEPG